MTEPATALAEAYAHCEAQVKAADRTAWLAALFAPAAVRPALHALRAFLVEVDGVRAKVREPLAGELRLQWWSDAIEGEARGDVRGHPIAAALIDTIHHYKLPRATLTELVEVRREDLYDATPADFADFDARADRGEGAVYSLSARILGANTDATEAAALHAGRVSAVASAIASLGTPHAGRIAVHLPLATLATQGTGVAEVTAGRPTAAIRGALELMQAHGDAAIAALRKRRPAIAPEAAAAFLPVNIAVRRLRLMRNRADPFAPPPDLPQWRKQWVLWRAAGRNGIL